MKRKILLSPQKKITGLCAGIADHLNIDPTVVRLIAVAIGIFTAVLPALLVYLIISLFFERDDEHYYDYINNTGKKFYKSSTKKVFAGVCGGLAEAFNKDATIIRLIWALTFIIFGYGLILYIAAAIIVPREPVQQW